ncbi:RagB/SusD family nutrient uptake outer membrane protein [Mariniphaga sediminis]|nr:RagB/SusD family nutrient uptake outer membrane protein [Mariniphaga sediminis]
MKNIKYFLIFLTITFWSCDDFLDKYPHDELSDNTFWKNEEELQMGLTACYGLMQNEYISSATGSGDKVYWDGLTDNAFVSDFWGLQEFYSGDQNPTNDLAGGLYSKCYNVVAAVNSFLSKIDLVDIEQEKKNKYIAEARFIRAYVYHELVLNFGGVPLFSSEPTIESASVGRSTKEEVMTLINNDLDFAIENLPDESYTGHVVKNSARGLKARVLLYGDDWSGVAQYTQDIMSSGKTSLYTNYKNMFINEGQGDDNTEILFSIKFLAPEEWHNIDYRVGGPSHINVLEDLVNDYLTINGLPIDEDPIYNPDSLHKNRDPRLQQTIFCEEGEPWIYDVNNGYTYYFTNNTTKFSCKKYIDESVQASHVTQSDQDIVLLRYGDVLLMYAEAKNELGQFGQNEWNQSIRLIRERAGFIVSQALDFPGGNQSNLREIIRHERRIEMAFEGFRYYDLLRWGNIKEVWENIEGENPQVRQYNENKPLFPIPESQIDYYNNNDIPFEQNPGYN